MSISTKSFLQHLTMSTKFTAYMANNGSLTNFAQSQNADVL